MTGVMRAIGTGRGRNRLAELCADQRGAETIEWVLVTLLGALGSYLALVELIDALGQAFNKILNQFLA